MGKGSKIRVRISRELALVHWPKSAAYGLPLGIALSVFIYYQFGSGVSSFAFTLPWGAILACIAGILAIVFTTMMLSGAMIRNDNIVLSVGSLTATHMTASMAKALVGGVSTAIVLNDGPRAALCHTYRYGDSVVRQEVAVFAGSRRVDFVTTVDWQEKERMLRTSFPVDVTALEAWLVRVARYLTELARLKQLVGV